MINPDDGDEGEEFEPDDELEDVDDEEGEGHPEPEVTIEISGLSLYTRMGVTEAEREVGQRLLLDVRIEVGDCDATVTDRVVRLCVDKTLAEQRRAFHVCAMPTRQQCHR